MPQKYKSARGERSSPCDPDLPQCESCEVCYYVHRCGCIGLVLFPNDDCEYCEAQSPTKKPKLTLNEVRERCGRSDCNNYDTDTPCKGQPRCLFHVILYGCACLEIDYPSMDCPGQLCDVKAAKSAITRPDIKVSHYTWRCENCIDVGGSQRIGEDAAQRTPHRSYEHQPQSYREPELHYPNITSNDTRRPTARQPQVRARDEGVRVSEPFRSPVNIPDAPYRRPSVTIPAYFTPPPHTTEYEDPRGYPPVQPTHRESYSPPLTSTGHTTSYQDTSPVQRDQEDQADRENAARYYQKRPEEEEDRLADEKAQRFERSLPREHSPSNTWERAYYGKR